MATAKVWENYFSSNTNKGSDEEVLSMIKDVAQTIKLMDKMYTPQKAAVITRGLLQDWYSLKQMADARGLTNYEQPYSTVIDVEATVVS